MGKKRTPQTPRAYARHLFDFDGCPASLSGPYVEVRIQAFIEGVKWERRRKAKLDREPVTRTRTWVRATHSG
jgi:hypothetical protein